MEFVGVESCLRSRELDDYGVRSMILRVSCQRVPTTDESKRRFESCRWGSMIHSQVYNVRQGALVHMASAVTPFFIDRRHILVVSVYLGV